MYRFLLTPRWWGIHLLVLAAVVVCLVMGSWQLARFEARVDSHRAAEQRYSGDAPGEQSGQPVPVEELLPVDHRTSGRSATASGRYDAGHQLLVPDRALGDRRGYYVLTLLRTDGGGGTGTGPALPVVRGWLPGEPDPARVPAPPDGEVTVVGALQASEHRDSEGVQAGGGLPRGQLGIISAAALVNVVPYQVYDAWVTLPEAAPPMQPVPPTAPDGSGLDLKAFQNLGYTAEWFVFAGFVLFMWYRLVRRSAEAAQDRALGLPAADGDPSVPDRTDGQDRTSGPDRTDGQDRTSSQDRTDGRDRTDDPGGAGRYSGAGSGATAGAGAQVTPPGPPAGPAAADAGGRTGSPAGPV